MRRLLLIYEPLSLPSPSLIALTALTSLDCPHFHHCLSVPLLPLTVLTLPLIALTYPHYPSLLTYWQIPPFTYMMLLSSFHFLSFNASLPSLSNYSSLLCSKICSFTSFSNNVYLSTLSYATYFQVSY
jgi:hypothetical protein